MRDRGSRGSFCFRNSWVRVLGSHERPAISPHVLPDSITILAHWVRPYAQTKPYIRESYCGASLLVTSRSCNYSLNIDPIGAELVVVIRMYAEGHWVAVQWGDVSEESDGHSPPSSDDLNLVCDLWAILNWDQDGCQHSSLTQKVRTRVTTWVRTKSKARILVQSNELNRGNLQNSQDWIIVLSSSLSDVGQVESE